MRIDQVVTRGGDAGETGLADGRRVPKTHPRVGALGAVDELNAAVGFARVVAGDSAAEHLGRVQQDLFDLGADLAVPVVESSPEPAGEGERPPLRITAGQVERLDGLAERLADGQEPLTSFVLPGGGEAAARLHLARTVCRRAERAAWALHEREPLNPEATRYLNRLSDLLFLLAREANDGGRGDVLWTPGANRGPSPDADGSQVTP